MAKRKKQHVMWVIFAFPQQFNGPNKYIAADGSVTSNKARAASFFSHGDAVDWAAKRRVTLTATTYVGSVSFTEFEMQTRVSPY